MNKYCNESSIICEFLGFYCGAIEYSGLLVTVVLGS